MPTIQYTPNTGFFGTDAVGYRVTNADGGSDTATIGVLVVDTEPPTQLIVAPAAGQQLPLGTTTVSAAGTAADNDAVQQVQYRLNGGTWLTATGTSSWTATLNGLTDGSAYTLEVRAVDVSGNVSVPSTRLFSVTGDGTNPTVTITDPSSELPANTSSYVVQGTSIDDTAVALVEFRVGGGGWQAASGTTAWTADVSGLVNGGSINFEARATDTGGNVSSVAQRTISVNQAPSANDDSVSTPQDMSVIVDVLGNDSNIDAGATLSITVPASNGSAIVVP